MRPSTSPVNIFVLGDLVVDHFIPIVEKPPPFEAALNETVANGLPRRTIAGGAANSARQIAALCRGGRTCLWGPSGASPWGTFLQLLQRSQNIDGVDNPIAYLGSHNEAHPTNTVTRIVRVSEGRKFTRAYRIDNLPKIPVADSAIRDVLRYLREEHAQSRIQAILLNDLDMKALSADLVSKVGRFAQRERIPVLVDPKRNWNAYRTTDVICTMPNLKEWCHIVDDIDAEPRWRSELDDTESLKRMAARSVRFMPRAQFHIIKCDKDGAVFIGPDGPGELKVCHIKAAAGRDVDPSPQIGTGDILAGALAVEIARLDFPSEINFAAMIAALNQAFGVVACYVRLDWQRVPNERELRDFDKPELIEVTKARISDGISLVPSATDPIDLAEVSVESSNLVSRDGRYRSEIQRLLEFLRTDWDTDASSLKSGILTGRGGVGKSDIVKILSTKLENIKVLEWKASEYAPKLCPDVRAAIEKIKASRSASRSGRMTKDRLVIVVDEAFAKVGHLVFGTNGKMLLQLANESCGPTRFLFVDASFETYKKENKFERSQFLRRCESFELPELALRRGDIPYIFAAACIRAQEKLAPKAQRAVEISQRALLGVINWVLQTRPEDQTPAQIIKEAKAAVTVAHNSTSRGALLKISRRHLSEHVREAIGPWHPDKQFVTFIWS
jgi:bifunctional ADP-heptose synthase (sugar kinase/adenylyltransferase)